MIIVVDASVIVKWVVPEPQSGAAEELKSQALVAPAIWIAEVANVLWRRVASHELDRFEAAIRLARAQKAPLATVPIESEIQEALALAAELQHPVYDCLYLALALRENTHVATADRRFAALATKHPHLAGRIKPLASLIPG